MTATGTGTKRSAAGAVIANGTNHTGLWSLGGQTLPFIPGVGTDPSGDGADGDLAEVREDAATERLGSEDEIRFDPNAGGMIGQSAAFQEVLVVWHVWRRIETLRSENGDVCRVPA